MCFISKKTIIYSLKRVRNRNICNYFMILVRGHVTSSPSKMATTTNWIGIEFWWVSEDFRQKNMFLYLNVNISQKLEENSQISGIRTCFLKRADTVWYMYLRIRDMGFRQDEYGTCTYVVET